VLLPVSTSVPSGWSQAIVLAVEVSAANVVLSFVSAPLIVEKAGKGGLVVACARLGIGHRIGPGEGEQ